MLVIDEADLVFSYGYEYDLKTLLRYLQHLDFKYNYTCSYMK